MEQAIKLLESVQVPRIEREHAVPLVIGIAAATSLLYSSYHMLHRQKRAHKQGIKEIPVPGSAYPYVGHILSLGALPGKKISEWHRELGPIIKLQMGVKTWVLVDDPVLAHKIFVTHGTQTSFRPYGKYIHDYYSMGCKGVAQSQPNGEWRKNRSAALSVIAPKQIENYMDSIQKEARDLVSRFIASTERDGSINPLKYLELNSLNVIFNLSFGRKFDSVDDPEFKELTEVIETTMKYGGVENDMSTFLPIFSIVDYFSGLQAKMRNFIVTRRDPAFRKLIREASKMESPNLIKSLDEDGFNMTEDDKVVFMSDVISGGTDTISVTLLNIFAILCHHPKVQKQVSTEIDKFTRVHGRVPHFKERLELPFCISVIKECMRLRPTTPFGLPHAVEEDVEVDGYILPKGCSVISNMESMHKRPEYFPQPETFIPARFINNTKTLQSAANGKLEERDHFNFGWGRRICPAIHLAEVEIFTAFVQVFARCFIEPESETSYPDLDGAVNAGLTTLPLPYKVKFTKRVDALI